MSHTDVARPPDRLPSEHCWVRVDGLRIHYRYSPGDGPAIVMLPGGMVDSSAMTWRPAFEALPAHYRVFVPDLPGYGRSDKPDAAYTSDYFVRFTERLLDVLGLDRVCLMGSSMSGVVALGLALEAPARVEGLVLSGAYGVQERVAFHEGAFLLAQVPGIDVVARSLLRLHPYLLRLAMPIAVHEDVRITRALVRDAYDGVVHGEVLKAFVRWLRTELGFRNTRTNYRSRVATLEMPCLVLHGAYDWMLPSHYTRDAFGDLPSAEVHLFPDAGHLVPRERPASVNQLVKGFLQRLYASGEGTAKRSPE